MVTLFAFTIALPVVLLLLIYTAEIAAGLFADSEDIISDVEFPRTVVLIPAHNEAEGIAKMLTALVIPANSPIEILVVADNCTDDTVVCATAAGAKVIARIDPARRGKGFALAFGRDAMAAAPPDCVVILDADCVVAGDGLTLLTRYCAATGRPVQSCYLMRGNLAAPVAEQASNFAFLVKNLVRQRGMTRLGGVATLNGSGMALPWSMFRDAPLANDDIVEDLALGVWLTRQGWPPLFLSRAVTWSEPAAGADLLVQRMRWEHGFAATARRHALPLIGAGLGGSGRAPLWLGLHLLVPPLALLFVVAAGVLFVTTITAILGASGWPAKLVALAQTAAGAVTLLAWYRAGRSMIAPDALLRVPYYIAAKLPIYLGLFGKRTTRWVRTPRTGEGGKRDV